MIRDEDHQRFANWISDSQRLVLTTHMNPDGDALGSEIGLALFLEQLGHHVTLLNADPTPDSLAFLLDGRPAPIVFEETDGRRRLANADRVILLDNSAPDRLGCMERAMVEVASKTCCIDHHPTRGMPWSERVLDVSASATSEIVYDLVTGRGWIPDRVAARALYVGIATDTGFFRFNSTTANAHRIVSALLDLGVETADCYRRLYERNSLAFTRLLGQALSDIQLDGAGAVASVRLTQALLNDLEAQNEDVSEIANVLLAMDGVRIALLFRELREGSVKVSLRSKGPLDVHALAVRYGGGGHRNASGIVALGSIADVAAEVVSRAVELVAAEKE